ncbi:ROK family protein [Salinarimonas soli]|uniref:ROK family protein n=1 Tax=Salinarimonas soli TaxID=1638099 RepID=A0A5B2VF31_9HYPH|nr:ROK family protein [Salinarimonas soli]KAA2237228.1 ROK family protein [Salinarimonas soli]
MRIGIDWGGTKMEAIALDGAGTILARRRIATPQGDYRACIAAAAGLVREIERETGREGSVGLGIPGAISPATGLVKNANSTWLNGQPLDRDMAEALGRPVRVENDANCLAVSEAADGAAAGAGSVWALILGTGVGSGIAIGGRALSGRHRIAGEWGHNPLPWPRADELPGPACYCGRSGCLETWLSGTGVAADHARRTGARMRAEEIVEAMRAGDRAARDTFERFLDRAARGIAHGVNILDPDVIVIGGGLSNVDELIAALPRLTAPYVFSDAFTTPIVRSRHGDSSGVRGAAWLW